MIRTLFFHLIFACFFNMLLADDNEPKCEYRNDTVPAIWCSGKLTFQKPIYINQWLKDIAKQNKVEPSSIRHVSINYVSSSFRASGNEFDGFPNLETIFLKTYVSGRNSRLHPSTFANLPKLQRLHLEGFKLVPDPQEHGHSLEPLSKSITWLYIGDSNVGESTDIFRNFENLDTVHLNGTSITDLQQDTFEKSAKKIRVFRVTNSKLTTIKSSTFNDFYNLEELDLQSNEIASVESKAFDNLGKLKIANLEDNKLTSLPEGLFKRGKLCKLGLEKNPSKDVIKHSFEHPGCTVSSALRASGTMLLVVALVGLVRFLL